MKPSPLPVQLSALLLVAAAFTGCVTQPNKPVSASPAKAVPAAESAPVLALAEFNKLPVTLPLAPPPLSTEAAEFVARFTQPGKGNALPHEMVDTTSFPEAMASLQQGAQAPKFEPMERTARSMAPVEGLTADGNSTQLIVQDWTGLVLVPISTSLSMAHTTSVRLLKVEAHPLTDGRVRIWIRVKNVGQQDFTSEVATDFRMHGQGAISSPYFYELKVPAREYRDVFFVSPEGRLSNYTVLVRKLP